MLILSWEIIPGTRQKMGFLLLSLIPSSPLGYLFFYSEEKNR